VAKEQESLELEEIISMDWLVENIVGSIPAYEELNDMGKATVGIVGVKPATEEKTPKEDGTQDGKQTEATP
jgi:hypothetical protein